MRSYPASSLLKLDLLWLAALFAALAALTGCGVGRLAPPSVQMGAALHGQVHGGQAPINGAHVYLLAANTTGYGGYNLAPSALNISTSLLNVDDTGASDDTGAYVLTDAAGDFDISGDYTCTAGTEVYLYVHGGDAGGGTNSAIGLFAILGNCSAGNFASVPFIEINEVSTIAAAYSFAGFASDATHVSSNGSPLALTGIANAFATASNLADTGTATALAVTPAGNGLPPNTTVNTLANILASCVNTADTTQDNISHPGSAHPLITRPHTLPYSSACISLGDAATGGNFSQFNGYVFDTATVAIFIAHTPGLNVHALYTLPTPQAPFSPPLGAEPNDFTLSIPFTGGGVVSAQDVVIDAAGDVWISSYNNTIAELNPLGSPVSSVGFTDPSLDGPVGMAIDSSGDIWVANEGSAAGSLTEFDDTGAFLRTASVTYRAERLAIDSFGDLWVPNTSGSGGDVSKLSSTGALFASYSGGGLATPNAIAIDPTGNVYLSNYGSASGLTEYNNAGTPNPSDPFTAGGISASATVAFDSTGDIWTLNNNGSISAVTTADVALSGSPYNSGTGASQDNLAIDGQNNVFALTNTLDYDTFTETYNLLAYNNAGTSLTTSGLTAPVNANYFAIDGSGNLWITNLHNVVEVVGVAAPVVTPLSTAVTTNCIAQRPCTPPVAP